MRTVTLAARPVRLIGIGAALLTKSMLIAPSFYCYLLFVHLAQLQLCDLDLFFGPFLFVFAFDCYGFFFWQYEPRQPNNQDRQQ